MIGVASVPRYGMQQSAMHNENGIFDGYSAETIAGIAGVHITSARRWKRAGAPEHIHKLLRLLLQGDLAVISPAWRGWRIERDRLHSIDDAYTFSPGEILSLPFRLSQIAALEKRNKFAVQADWVAGCYNEPDETIKASAVVVDNNIIQPPQRLERAQVTPLKKAARTKHA